MTLHQFLLILRARWVSALVVLLAAFGLAIAVSLVMPKRYTATASVMLDVRSPDPVAGMVLAGMMTPAYMATQVDLISSERVARRAIQALKLNQNPATRDQWIESTKGQGDYEAWLSEALLQQLSVKPAKESNVINIEYSSPDPNFSAGMANAFMQAYIDTSLELRVDPARQYNAFFENRAKELRADLEAAQSKLSTYQKSKGLLATDGRFDIENSRLSELSTQLVMLQALAAESGSRLAQTGARAQQVPEVMNNPLVAGLTADLAREETRFKELTSRLGDNHPSVVEARVRIAELRAKLDAATVRASGGVNVTNTVNQDRLAQVRAALDAQRAKVLQLKMARDEAAVLERDVENAQRAYDAILQRTTQSNIESQNTQTNISVIKNATPSPSPSAPRPVLYAAMGLALGLLLAVITALLRELFDRRLRDVEDVTADLHQPLLVMLPVSNHRKKLGKSADGSRARLVKARVLTGLPRPTQA